MEHQKQFSLIKALCASCFIAFCSCSISDSEDSDFSPSVRDAVGCWISTENIGESRYFTYQDQEGYNTFNGVATPSETCMELCIQENSSFTFVANVTGSDFYPDFYKEIQGTVEAAPVSYSGVGGSWWTWSKENSSDKENSDVRLVNGQLTNVNLKYSVSDKNGTLYFSNESQRKYRRTEDPNACVNAKEK